MIRVRAAGHRCSVALTCSDVERVGAVPGCVPGGSIGVQPGLGLPRRRQGRASPGDARTHGPYRNLEDLRDLLIGEITDITQHDRGAEFDGEHGEGSVDVDSGSHDVGRITAPSRRCRRPPRTAPTGDLGSAAVPTVFPVRSTLGGMRTPWTGSSEQAPNLGRDAVGDFCDIEGDPGHRLAPAAPQFVDADVGGDAVKPCAERAAPVEAAQAPDGRQKCVLRRVEGVGVIAEHPPT